MAERVGMEDCLGGGLRGEIGEGIGRPTGCGVAGAGAWLEAHFKRWRHDC